MYNKIIEIKTYRKIKKYAENFDNKKDNLQKLKYYDSNINQDVLKKVFNVVFKVFDILIRLTDNKVTFKDKYNKPEVYKKRYKVLRLIENIELINIIYDVILNIGNKPLEDLKVELKYYYLLILKEIIKGTYPNKENKVIDSSIFLLYLEDKLKIINEKIFEKLYNLKVSENDSKWLKANDKYIFDRTYSIEYLNYFKK